MPQQLLTIARNTFTEAIRQPVFTVLLLVGAIGMVLNPQLAAYSMETGGGDDKMLVDMGLSTLFLISLFLAAFIATGVLSSEVENKTVLTVVSKPVPRPIFVTGKFLGVAGAIGLAYYCLAIVFILTVRHEVMSTARQSIDQPVMVFGIAAFMLAMGLAAWGNYFYRWVFTSTFATLLAAALTLALALVLVIGKGWVVQSPLVEFLVNDARLAQICIGLILVFEAVLILTAIAIAASTRLGQVMTLVICLGVFLLGLMTNSMSAYVNTRINAPPGLPLWDSVAAILQTQQGIGFKTAYLLTKLGYAVLPNLQILWPADAINDGNMIPLAHVATVSGYAGLYILSVVCIAVALFQTREVG